MITLNADRARIFTRRRSFAGHSSGLGARDRETHDETARRFEVKPSALDEAGDDRQIAVGPRRGCVLRMAIAPSVRYPTLSVLPGHGFPRIFSKGILTHACVLGVATARGSHDTCRRSARA